MNNKDRVENLEAIIAQMLRPVQGIPFSVVIKSLSNFEVFPFSDSAEDVELVARMEEAAKIAGRLVVETPIRRPRPNEVGNDMEPYVLEGLKAAGLNCSRPLTQSGKGRSTGYPDILVQDRFGRYTYVECKIYSADTKITSQRSFYLSPSADFKVSVSARHVVFGFEMTAEAVGGSSRDSYYRPCAYSVIDVHDLECDVKYEFNSDNFRLYSRTTMLASGLI